MTKIGIFLLTLSLGLGSTTFAAGKVCGMVKGFSPLATRFSPSPLMGSDGRPIDCIFVVPLNQAVADQLPKKDEEKNLCLIGSTGFGIGGLAGGDGCDRQINFYAFDVTRN